MGSNRMHDEEDYARFFTYLTLFVEAMLILVSPKIVKEPIAPGNPGRFTDRQLHEQAWAQTWCVQVRLFYSGIVP